MWTIILSILIFGGAGWILYSRLTGRSSSCEDCQCSCSGRIYLIPKKINNR
nr:FeoB-associated Cys-rich membrane protein [Enterococcus asini]